MDIAFHYFAVKSLAVLGGFPDEDAQIIAQYSQMVDDFDYTNYWSCTNIPDYIKNNPKYDLCVQFGFFNPAQTGFLCDGILGKTDYLNLVTPRFQRFTCTPFHFIYQNRNQIDTKEYRVSPATLNNNSIISNMLIEAKREYILSQYNTLERRKALMKIGMLMHIFADTFAHQMFSGFNAYANQVELVNVINNINGKDETKKYNSKIVSFLKILKTWAPFFAPSIGHMMLEHIPDLTHLSFTMKYKDGAGNEHTYSRSNTSEFLKVSKEILNYFLSCNGIGEVPDENWAIYRDAIRQSFLTDISGDSNEEAMVAHLKKVWNTPRCTYNYSSKEIKKSFVLSTSAHQSPDNNDNIIESSIPFNSTKASEDFYIFNVIADEVLINLYGDHPRTL